MQPEDRLDALLSLRMEDTQPHSEQPFANGVEDDGELQPLLDAARLLTALGSDEPSPGFAARLETRFLTRAASVRESNGFAPLPLADDSHLPSVTDAPPPGNDDPTLPGIEWAAALDDATEADGVRYQQRYSAARRHVRWRRLLWPALAAALLLAIGMTTLTAAASAGPGSPLYGLRRWEQHVQVNMAGSAADRTSLHLSYAQDALAALDTTNASRQTGATYDDALATFRDEMRAATSNLSSVPAGNQRDALAAQLERLRSQGRATLRAALASLPWAERVATTAALAEIGDNVLSVTQASMLYSGHGQRLWQITVSGSGFQQGAVLLVNGRPAGAVISITPTTLVAQLTGDDSAPLPNSIGVANPDSTAALTTSLSSHEQDGEDTPGPQQTPGDDHGGDTHSGSGSDGGSSGGSSTPDTSGGSGGSINSGEGRH